MKKRISKHPQKPAWYPLPAYTGPFTPEKWLQEIWKRSNLKKTFESNISNEQKQKAFTKILLDNDISDIVEAIEPKVGESIKPMSVLEVFYLAASISNTHKYQNHPRKQYLEQVIQKITLGIELDNSEKEVFGEFVETPWFNFFENMDPHQYPKLQFTHGEPVTINALYIRKDITTELNNKLTKWVGKPTGIDKKFSRWEEKKVLAVFDLHWWNKIYYLNYKNIDLAKILWKNPPLSKNRLSSVDLYDHFDKAAELSEKVIVFTTVHMLTKICMARKAQKQQQEKLHKVLTNKAK